MEEPKPPSDPSKPASVEAKSQNEEQVFDAKMAFEKLEKGLNDTNARLSKIEGILDEYEKTSENEGDAKLAAEKPEEKKEEGMKEELAKHSKEMSNLKTEISGMKKSYEELGQALAKHGYSKLQPSSAGTQLSGDEEIAAAAKAAIAGRLGR